MRLPPRWAALLGAGLLTACGWSAGLAGPDGAESIGVAFFEVDQNILARDLEPELHGALTLAVSNLVDARLVTPDQGDLVITGEIVDYARRGGIRSRQADLVETAVRVVVEARLVRRRDGVVLAKASGSVPIGYATADRTLDPGTGEEDFLVGGRALETDARARAMRILAEGLILDLLASESSSGAVPAPEPAGRRATEPLPPR